MENALRKSYSPYELLSLKFGDISLGILTILLEVSVLTEEKFLHKKLFLKLFWNNLSLTPLSK